MKCVTSDSITFIKLSFTPTSLRGKLLISCSWHEIQDHTNQFMLFWQTPAFKQLEQNVGIFRMFCFNVTKTYLDLPWQWCKRSNSIETKVCGGAIGETLPNVNYLHQLKLLWFVGKNGWLLGKSRASG